MSEFKSSVHVEIWEIQVSSSDIAKCRNLLSAEELERMQRFRFEEDQNRYATAHAALRSILGERLSVAPLLLQFSAGNKGKPHLPDGRLSFNLSHAGDWVWIAISEGAQVGVDIERMKEIEATTLMKRFASPEELQYFSTVSKGDQQGAFFTWWTRKEAYLKGVGEGLSGGLDSFTAWKGSSSPVIVSDPVTGNQWSIHSVDAPVGYRGGLATSCVDAEIVRHRWQG